mmetsp:Transcript_495/g.697  ORF Transcript_495/g.697 Transcript_495/m.697 type:complete len:326 (-) Transcript_495:180-1157(-)
MFDQTPPLSSILETVERMDSPHELRDQPQQQTIKLPISQMIPMVDVQLEDFCVIEVIGMGTFARVILVRQAQTGKLFALKSMRKSEIVRLRQVQHVLSEKNILSRVSHPNIINMHATFNDDIHVYLLLEYAPQGELFRKLRVALRFSEKTTLFYAANIVLALEYLHSLQIVYRDLKPENILVLANGYLKLTDFGFAKELSSKTWSICGTPDYVAPEIIQNLGHGLQADWWSLGIVIYEMLTGLPPFHNDSNRIVYDNIVNAEVTFPKHVGHQAQDLISNLLIRNPSERLGNVEDAKDIKSHKWFKDIDFDDVFNQTMEAPAAGIL